MSALLRFAPFSTAELRSILLGLAERPADAVDELYDEAWAEVKERADAGSRAASDLLWNGPPCAPAQFTRTEQEEP